MSEGTTLAGWGRLPAPGREVVGEDLARLTLGAVLTRGLGRSYGDSALPPPGRLEVVGSRLADRILAFDAETGLLRAEAGLSLAALVETFLPRGFWPPVVPGTKFVTLGGMAAADVHGKNHHVEGTFGRHVTALMMRLADGRVVECDRDRHGDLFRATIGGMGLTGHMLEVECRLARVPSPWIWEETERIRDLDRFIAELAAAARDWPFTVGWIDCLARGRAMGRGLLIRGRWAEPGEAPDRFPRSARSKTVPFVFPSWALGRPSARLFNALYYRKQMARVTRGIASPDSFFFPLDAILHWNRIYGPRGFTQYQCVIPETDSPGGTRRFLDELTRRGGASFLCVIKDCGVEGEGLLSFPRAGISIAVDLPVRSDTQALVDALNERVLEEGGRIYLAKDAFTRGEHFRAMEPRLEEFERVRRTWDPDRRIASLQSVRMLGDRPPAAQGSNEAVAASPRELLEVEA